CRPPDALDAAPSCPSEGDFPFGRPFLGCPLLLDCPGCCWLRPPDGGLSAENRLATVSLRRLSMLGLAPESFACSGLEFDRSASFDFEDALRCERARGPLFLSPEGCWLFSDPMDASAASESSVAISSSFLDALDCMAEDWATASEDLGAL